MGFSNHGSHGGPPPPPPPPPPPRPRGNPLPAASIKQNPAPQPIPPRSIGIGIETEFLLRPRDPKLDAATIRDFSRHVASGYLQHISQNPTGHPKMHNAIDESYLGTRFAEWSLDSDSTIKMPNKGQAPCQISPTFRCSDLTLVQGVWRTFLPSSVLIRSLCGVRTLT